jgi:hypothetical protein
LEYKALCLQERKMTPMAASPHRRGGLSEYSIRLVHPEADKTVLLYSGSRLPEADGIFNRYGALLRLRMETDLSDDSKRRRCFWSDKPISEL